MVSRRSGRRPVKNVALWDYHIKEGKEGIGWAKSFPHPHIFL